MAGLRARRGSAYTGKPCKLMASLSDCQTIKAGDDVRDLQDLGEIRQFPAPLRAAIVGRLRAAIISGQLKPGDRLVEARLAKSLKISRPSLREAMRQIEAEGLIEIVPNVGPVVVQHSLDEMRQIRDLRVPVESLCARYFALHASDAEVNRLESAVDRVEAALVRADVGEIIKAKQLYYGALTEGCGSAIVAKYLLQLIAMTSYRWGASLTKPGRPAESIFEMRRLVEAIRARSPERAAAASETLARHAASVGLEAEAAAQPPTRRPDSQTG